MGETEYECVGCKKSHLASFWYTRDGKYLCGDGFNKLPDGEKARWQPLEGYGPVRPKN